MKVVVIGGGLSGLLACKAILKKNPAASIVLLEKNTCLGGILSGISYPEADLYFDSGTHIFQETGNNALDTFLLSALPSDNLIHFERGFGDLAGSIFGGILQENTHFPDLRGKLYNTELIEFLRKHIALDTPLPPIDRLAPLIATSSQRFGVEFTDAVIAPTLSRTFNYPAELLSAFALLLPGWTRVVIDDHPQWFSNIHNLRYRSLVAVPEQRELPESLHHGRRSFYSRRNGTKAFIDGISLQLAQQGVDVFCETPIIKIDPLDMKVYWRSSIGDESLQSADKIIIATGALGAANVLDIDLSDFAFDPPIPYRVINLLLEQAPNSDLCYLYGLDESCDWYRVTNYSAITGNKNDTRLSVEILGDPSSPIADLPQIVANQLRNFHFLDSSNILFSDVYRFPGGYPLPSINNMRSLCNLGETITSNISPNIVVAGIGTNGGLFFQNEIASDLFNRILNFS